LPYVIIGTDLCKDARSICVLLSTSKAIAQLLEQQCAGSITLRCDLGSLQQAEQFAAFIAKHGRLLQSLELQLPQGAAERRLAEHLLSSALASASHTAAAPATAPVPPATVAVCAAATKAARSAAEAAAGAAAAAAEAAAAATDAVRAAAADKVAAAAEATKAAAAAMTAMADAIAATTSAAGTATSSSSAAGGHSQQQQLQLPLQMFSTTTPSDLLLRQLAVSSSSNLTKLDLTGPIFAHFPDAPQAAAAALSGLTRLRSMSLCLAQVTEDGPHALSSSAAALLPALAHLTALTALTLVRARTKEPFGWQYLPASLQQLAVSNDGFGPEMVVGPADYSDDACRLQLRHLTALTDLQLSGSGGMFPDDALPPNLVALKAIDPGVLTLLPLLDLQQLQRLTMECDALPAVGWIFLSSLGQLTELQLLYTSGEAAAEAAEVGPALPISALRLYDSHYEELPAAALLGISKLQGLTCLHVMPCHAAVTAQQFAAVVAQT
jgi:hypothetical protein